MGEDNFDENSVHVYIFIPPDYFKLIYLFVCIEKWPAGEWNGVDEMNRIVNVSVGNNNNNKNGMRKTA